MADTAPVKHTNPDWMKWCKYMEMLLMRVAPALRETAPEGVEPSIPPTVMHSLHVQATQCNRKFSAEDTAYALPQHVRAQCVVLALRWYNSMHAYADNCNVEDCEERSSPMWCVVADSMGFRVEHLQSMYDALPDVDKTMMWEYIKRLNTTAQAVQDSVHAIGWDVVLNGDKPAPESASEPASAAALAAAFQNALPGGEAQMKEIQEKMMGGGGVFGAVGSILSTPGMMQSILPATMTLMQNTPKDQLEAAIANATSLFNMQGAIPAKQDTPKPNPAASESEGSRAGGGGHGGGGHGGDDSGDHGGPIA